MASPSELIAHYSSHAFHTRVYALTFSGAVLGAVLSWNLALAQSGLIGLALIVVVGSLGELNRRFTHSYLAACSASSRDFGTPEVQEETRRRWAYFSRLNEAPWSVTERSLYRVIKLPGAKSESSSRPGMGWPRLVAFLKKFLLSWSTYIPGLLVGVLVIRGESQKFRIPGFVIAAVILLSWLIHSARELNPDELEKFRGEVMKLSRETTTTVDDIQSAP